MPRYKVKVDVQYTREIQVEADNIDAAQVLAEDEAERELKQIPLRREVQCEAWEPETLN